MGVSESSPHPEEAHPRASIETPSTYFGNSQMSEVDPKELRATIRDLHLVRLQKALGTFPVQSSANLKLKSMISITDASSIIALSNSVLFKMPLRLDSPCQVLCIANGIFNSIRYAPATDAIDVVLPIPARGVNFQIEISPDLNNAISEVKPDFLSVNKHVMRFQCTDSGARPIYEFVEHQLVIDGRVFHLDVLKLCETATKERSTACIICDGAEATEILFGCEDRLLCAACLRDRAPRLHHCPLCESATAP
jgi:hypothetical protein